MGLAGPGASRRRDAAKGAKREKLPWKDSKLSRVQRVIAFLEYLPITKGMLAGQKMRLLRDQKAFIRDVYGPKKIVRIGVKSDPRGQGKTGLCAGLALCHLLGPEAEVRGEAYSASIDRGMAGLLFNEMEAIIYAVPGFAARTNVQRFSKKIEVLSGDGIGSTYEALSADIRRGHGLAPSLWIYDELAQAKNRELLDNLMTAMGKRKKSLGLVISTQAANDDHPLSQLIDDGLTGADPGIVVHLRCAPGDADPFDKRVVRKANPALGIFLNQDDVFSEMERAKRIPAFESAFRNLRLNQRIDPTADHRLVTAETWRQGEAPFDVAALEGRLCYGGLDLSSKHDLTALVLCFPEAVGDQTVFKLVPFFWTPEGQLDGRKDSEKALFREWIRRSHLKMLPGPIIRYGHVAREIHALTRLFDIQTIGYDRWRIDDLKVELAELGLELPLEPFGPGYTKTMAPAIEWFTECVVTGRVRHNGHPLLTASVSNAIVTTDKAGNPMIDKPKSSRNAMIRVDGAIAAVIAMRMAQTMTASQYVSDSLVVAR